MEKDAYRVNEGRRSSVHEFEEERLEGSGLVSDRVSARMRPEQVDVPAAANAATGEGHCRVRLHFAPIHCTVLSVFPYAYVCGVHEIAASVSSERV